MKRRSTERFAILDKHGHYAKPFIDDSPYLLFKTKTEAERCISMDPVNRFKVIKVRIIIDPVKGCS